jgi:hypothetical protein
LSSVNVSAKALACCVLRVVQIPTELNKILAIRLPLHHSVRSYIIAHWLGHQSLAWSFWVNLVVLRVLVFSFQTSVGSGDWNGSTALRLVVVVAVVVLHGLLLIWQIVGVVRAADVHFLSQGNMALVWGSQLGAVLLFVLTIIYSIEAIQMTMVSPHQENPLARIARERANQYSLTVGVAKRELSIDGLIELGITRAVRRIIHDHPSITRVNLTSEGGNIFEARGLAKLFTKRKLDTHIIGVCASACTTAFVGGLKRSAEPGASVGFHQYRIDAKYAIIATDVKKEQTRDANLFLAAGVSEEFVRAMFDRVPQSMWWPSSQELLQAGFINDPLH